MRFAQSLCLAALLAACGLVPALAAQTAVRADTSGVVQAGASVGMDRVRARLEQVRSVDRVRRRFERSAPSPVIVVVPPSSAAPRPVEPVETVVRYDPLTGLYTRRPIVQPGRPPITVAPPDTVPDTVFVDRPDTVVVPVVMPAPGPAILPVQPAATLAASTREVERALFETGVFRAVGINFAFGRSEILDGAEALIDPIGEVLVTYPELYMEVGGHTDDIGGDAANQALSERRAESVALYLRERWGIAPERLRTAGYGETVPLVSNTTPTGRTLNRRVDFRAIAPPSVDAP